MARAGGSGSEFVPDDEEDETLLERLVGLTEMFPEGIRSKGGKVLDFSVKSVKKLYSWGRTGTWIIFSTAVIAVAPVLFEVERFQLDEMQKMQQRQMLLGPNVARA